MTSASPDVEHHAESGTFRIRLAGGDAVLSYHRLASGQVVFASTVVPPAHRGRGHGERLVLHALAHARDAGWRLATTCWFVSDMIHRHPEFQPLFGAAGAT